MTIMGSSRLWDLIWSGPHHAVRSGVKNKVRYAIRARTDLRVPVRCWGEDRQMSRARGDVVILVSRSVNHDDGGDSEPNR